VPSAGPCHTAPSRVAPTALVVLQMGATIRIPLQIEPGAQPLKTFGITLTNPRGGATLGAHSSAEVRITDTR
jgi:hypothetical protein